MSKKNTANATRKVAQEPIDLCTLQSTRFAPEQRLDFVSRLKTFLSGPADFLPYVFHFSDNGALHAPNPGMEGFLYLLNDIASWCSAEYLEQQLEHFINYTLGLLKKSGCSCRAIEELKREKKKLPAEKYAEFCAAAKQILENARNALSLNDPAQWIRNASIYQIYLRAFNLKGLRENRAIQNGDISGRLIEDIRAEDLPADFSTIRWTGTYPIGEVDLKGIGSPFAIRDHARIAAQYSHENRTKDCIQALEKAGISSIFELSPNHTSVDCPWLEKDPTLYIHSTKKPKDDFGYYRYRHKGSGKTYWIRRGGYLYDSCRYYWNDTLQLDISNPATLDVLVETLKTLVRDYGARGFRVDMAYQLLHEPFRATWGKEVKFKLSDKIEDEFFTRMISAVKAEFPYVGFLAEGFYRWEKLSAAGFDLVYSKNEMTLPGGFYHYGWYNALSSRNPWLITQAIKRACFLNWQKGGAGMLAFVGHHDLPAPQRVFQNWVWGATFLTLMLPTARNWYAGTEAGFEAPCTENQKMITFQHEVQIDWKGINSDFARFVKQTMAFASNFQREFGETQMLCLSPDNTPGWVGYMLKAQDQNKSKKRVLVLANPSDHRVEVVINRPELGINNFACSLPACGPESHRIEILTR